MFEDMWKQVELTLLLAIRGFEVRVYDKMWQRVIHWRKVCLTTDKIYNYEWAVEPWVSDPLMLVSKVRTIRLELLLTTSYTPPTINELNDWYSQSRMLKEFCDAQAKIYSVPATSVLHQLFNQPGAALLETTLLQANEIEMLRSF